MTGIAAGAFLLVVIAGVIGVLAVHNAIYAIMVSIAVAALGLAAMDLGVIAVLAVPATLVMVRVGGFLSVSDVVLAAATIVALLLISWREARELKGLVWLGVAYQASLVPTLALNPYAANFVEWFHEGFLVLGSMVIGWVIGRRNLTRAALGLYVLGCCGIGVAAFVTGLINLAHGAGWAGVYLPYLHKNFIGDSLALAFILIYARPDWVGLSRRWGYLAMAVLAAGIAASVSRQAIVSAVIGVAVVTLRPRAGGRSNKLVWFALIPAGIFVVTAVVNQLQSGNRFNSTYQRLAWFGQSVDIWMQSPLFGVGLRWWYTDRFDAGFQPPNAEFEMLTSAGVVGVLAFLALFTGAAWLLATMDPRYGTPALAVVATRFTQGQLDLYWVAGEASFLWIVAGIAYGMQAHDRHRQQQTAEVLPGRARPAVARRPGGVLARRPRPTSNPARSTPARPADLRS